MWAGWWWGGGSRDGQGWARLSGRATKIIIGKSSTLGDFLITRIQGQVTQTKGKGDMPGHQEPTTQSAQSSGCQEFSYSYFSQLNKYQVSQNSLLMVRWCPKESIKELVLTQPFPNWRTDKGMGCTRFISWYREGCAFFTQRLNSYIPHCN